MISTKLCKNLDPIKIETLFIINFSGTPNLATILSFKNMISCSILAVFQGHNFLPFFEIVSGSENV
jgi:hypothetical protein